MWILKGKKSNLSLNSSKWVKLQKVTSLNRWFLQELSGWGENKLYLSDLFIYCKSSMIRLKQIIKGLREKYLKALLINQLMILFFLTATYQLIFSIFRHYLCILRSSLYNWVLKVFSLWCHSTSRGLPISLLVCIQQHFQHSLIGRLRSVAGGIGT